MAIKCTVYGFTVLSFALGAMTLGMLALAVSTDSWLYMSEPVIIAPEVREMYNITQNFVVEVRSGLWRVCTINIADGQEPDHCMAIDYTQEGNGRLEGAPTCMTIVGAIRVAAPLPVSALILCMVAVILHSIGSIHGDRKTLIAASLYILSGLSLAVGIVLYISAINDEVGYRSSKRAEQTFVYNYGWSFYTAGIAFITSEMAAVVCVTLFLQRHMKVDDLEKLVPGLHLKIRSRRYSRRNYYSDCHQTLII